MLILNNQCSQDDRVIIVYMATVSMAYRMHLEYPFSSQIMDKSSNITTEDIVLESKIGDNKKAAKRLLLLSTI